MADQSPLLIFPFHKALTKSEAEKILDELGRFLSQWQTHQQPLAAKAWFEEYQFLCILVDPSLNTPSGCSKDKLFNFVNGLKNEVQEIDLSTHLFWVKKQNQILALSKTELRKEWELGNLRADNQLFPTWIDSFGDYKSQWGKPLSFFLKVLRLEKTAV